MPFFKTKQLLRFRKYHFLFVLAILIISCINNDVNSSEDEKIIAKIGEDYIVTLSDLKQYIKDWNYNQKFREKEKVYKNALNDLLTNQLKRLDFFDRKLNQNKDLMSKEIRSINAEIINAYFNKKFVSKYVSDSSAAKAYNEMDKEVICNDIFLPIPENPSQQKLDSLKAIALEIENYISNNLNIDELIKKHSLQNTLIVTQKNYTWSQSMNDPIAYVAYQLQNGSTQALYNLEGFHILKAVDIKKIKLEPFDDIKEEIISNLKKGYYQTYNDEYGEFRKNLVDYGTIIWNDQGLDQIVKWSNIDKFFGGAYQDTMKNAISNGNNFEILTYNKGKIDLKEFLRLLDEVVILNPNIQLNSKSVKEFISEAVYDNNVIKAAQKIGLDEKIVNPYTDNLVVKSKLSYLYNLEIIEGNIPDLTPEALKSFYDEQRDSIFYQLKKINLYTRIYSDKERAEKEIKEINSGIPFEKISNRWFVKTYIRERDGSLKSFRSIEPPYLAEAAFKLELNEVAGPIEFDDTEKGKQFAVIKAIHIMPEKQLTFDEVKGKRIEEEFKNYYRQKISDEVNAKLMKKYNVEIFEHELSQAITSN
ncbi:MAG: peptidyl-prolyl cis-trans isomerase [Ignavibacteriae bacterium]|nr:peptidyl-prolyl cis-trans isomerase [Ignavibacteriota bacterium]